MKYMVEIFGKKFEVEVKRESGSTFEVIVNGKRALVEISRKLPVAKVKAEEPVKKKVEERKVVEAKGKIISAPMAGVVTKLLKKEGEHVDEGEVVLVIEAMKMENPISSPHSGRITKIFVNEGDKVGSGDPLLSIE
ncbi:acetyl-CoA carboxylase biotin carboxyl carrier protein subunit [Archaeoglobales archaeon ex4484_92]|nr:MAG: acetyl-CoA carboxylase biotin carboxyl carrier protein subunit [Archaeoglobales archaeon ex4484_92]